MIAIADIRTAHAVQPLLLRPPGSTEVRAGRAAADAVLTRDLRDFRAIRGSTHTHFRILPDDAD
ncbi:hypothetical protein ACFYYD_03110 [Streptomyces bluensis]|uniref:hypothetical protein n=1 Tax=Streptomyces bluensis TaxID=33897 RepID=UPI0036A50655